MPIKDKQNEDERFIEELDEYAVAFTHEWDSGGPGAGAGAEVIYHRDGQFMFHSLDFGVQGPYSSLDEAIAANELLSVGSATTSISSSMLSTDEIGNRLIPTPDHVLEVKINGQLWKFHAAEKKFKPASDPG